MCLKAALVPFGKQYCGFTWSNLSLSFQSLSALARQDVPVNPPRTVCERMIGGDFAAIDSFSAHEHMCMSRYLTDDEELRLRNVIQTMQHLEQYLNEFEISIHTGMQKGEQCSLTWAQIDFKERRLTLIKTKNGSGRMIPLNSVALEALSRKKKITGHSTKVFLTGAGKEFGPDALRHWLNEAVKKAKILDFSWHCLRHSFCSRLIQNGVSLKAAQELMGQKVIAMTARYAHLAPEHLQCAVEAIAQKQPKLAA